MRFYILLIFCLLGSCSFSSLAQSKETALLIIDMQSDFIERNIYFKSKHNLEKTKRLLQRQKEVIWEAINNEIEIIVVEYKGAGETVSELKGVLSNYKKVKYLYKKTDNLLSDKNPYTGSIKNYFKKKNIKNICVIGANGEACVRKSLNGLLDNKIKVIPYSRGIADFNYSPFIYPYAYGRSSFRANKQNFFQVDNLEEVRLIFKNTTSFFKDINGYQKMFYLLKKKIKLPFRLCHQYFLKIL